MRPIRRFVHCPTDSVCCHCKNTLLSLLLLFSAQPRWKRSNRLRNKPQVRSSFRFCRGETLNDEDWLWMVEECWA
ncbi:hypothetical protein V6N13_113643 [Hibiscus sabdariffa]